MSDAELVHELFVALLRACRDRLNAKGKPASAELLAVSRKLMRDHGYIVPVSDEAERKKLQALHALYVRKLGEAVDHDPSAAVLAEVRQFLAQSGITKDLQGAMSNAQAVSLMGDVRIPFKSN